MNSTADRLLVLMRAEPAARPAREYAERLSISPRRAQELLRELQAEGLVERVAPAPLDRPHAGRPAPRYRLTDSGRRRAAARATVRATFAHTGSSGFAAEPTHHRGAALPVVEAVVGPAWTSLARGVLLGLRARSGLRPAEILRVVPEIGRGADSRDRLAKILRTLRQGGFALDGGGRVTQAAARTSPPAIERDSGARYRLTPSGVDLLAALARTRN